MSQSLLYHAFGVRKGYDYHRTSYVDGGVVFHLRPKPQGSPGSGCKKNKCYDWTPAEVADLVAIAAQALSRVSLVGSTGVRLQE